MGLPEIINVRVHIYSKNGIEERESPVSSEYHVVVRINGNPFVSIACSGSHVEMLALGHLISEGIIFSYGEIQDISFDEKKLEVNVSILLTDEILERLFRIRSIASGCGQGGSGIFPSAIEKHDSKPVNVVEPQGILSSMNEFLHSSSHHKLTRGVHSAALFDLNWKEVYFSDEIGRHNAIDKIIGFSCMNNIPMHDKIIFSTGRLSSEIVSKGINSGILGIISKSSPTGLSVEMAVKSNILLIGKVTRNGFYIYSGRDKLKTDGMQG